MEKQVEKEDWVTQTDFVLINCYQQEEETLIHTNVKIQEYYNSYFKREKDGERLIFSTGRIPIVKDGKHSIVMHFMLNGEL